MTNQAEAFHWIIGILTKHKVRYVVSGGLAARAYGAERDLFDFDFDIANDGFVAILDEVEPYRVSGPTQQDGAVFRNTLLRLNYEGQLIDLAGADGTELFDRATGRWLSDTTDLDRFELKQIFGLEVPVMNPSDLLAYKQRIDRPEDRIDCRAIEAYLHSHQSA